MIDYYPFFLDCLFFILNGFYLIFNIEYLINSNTYLNIKKMTKSIAMVYFTNLDNNRIDIPEEIKIYTINYINPASAIIFDTKGLP